MHSKSTTTQNQGKETVRLRALPTQYLVAMLLLSLGAVCLCVSIVILMLNVMRLSQTEVIPEDRQLLNRPSIEQASRLLEEQTVQFDLNGGLPNTN